MEQLESANKSAASTTCLDQNHDDHEQSQFIENDDGLIRFPAAAAAAASNDHQLLDSSRSKPHKLQAVDDSGEILDDGQAAAAAAHNEEDLYSMIYLKGIFNNVDSRSHHEAQGQVPFGNSLAGDSTIAAASTLHRNSSTETTHVMNSIILGSSTPLSRSLGINQGINPNIPMSSSTVLTRSGINGISNFGNGYSTNYESTIDITSASSYLAAQVPTISRQKRKMVWQDQDSSAPNHKRWSNLNIIQGESSRSFGSSYERFTLYDRRYEEIGLPLDPHLRIFNATKANGTVLQDRHS